MKHEGFKFDTMVEIEWGERASRVPVSESYSFEACTCGNKCGNVNVVLKDDEDIPFAATQFHCDMILGELVEAAIKARKLSGVVLQS